MVAFNVRTTGSFQNTERFLNRMKRGDIYATLDKFGLEGVNALQSNTPIDSGRTSTSWTYEIVKQRGSYAIVWNNENVVNGVNIAVILQYGHGTGTGGYVQGRDYINPALRPIFDRMAETVWKEVCRP